jgi:hypothetical protein
MHHPDKRKAYKLDWPPAMTGPRLLTPLLSPAQPYAPCAGPARLCRATRPDQASYASLEIYLEQQARWPAWSPEG